MFTVKKISNIYPMCPNVLKELRKTYFTPEFIKSKGE